MKNTRNELFDVIFFTLLLFVAVAMCWTCAMLVSIDIFLPPAIFLTACAVAVIIIIIKKGLK